MLKINKQQLNELIETELDNGTHWEDSYDFDTEEEFYLKNVKDDSYVYYCLKDLFPDLNEEDRFDIQKAVIEGIQERL